MSDKIIPFPGRGETPPDSPEARTTPEPEQEWTLVRIVAQAPPSSR